MVRRIRSKQLGHCADQQDFTQEEMGQMISFSRETVTRLLALLTRREIVQVTSDSIVIQDRPALQELALR